jgi:MFS family permease
MFALLAMKPLPSDPFIVPSSSTPTATAVSSDPFKMTSSELKASLRLSSIYALRMLGLFLILPVFALYAKTLPGGDNMTMVGLALGIYGLTQGLLQIPFGALSDKHGRKPIIAVGLAMLAMGSFVAAFATTIEWVIVGRALQGAGAISAAVVAFIADSTRVEVRSKAMGMVGGTIGASFALSLIVAPLVFDSIGVPGLFMITGVLAIAAIFVSQSVPLPPEPLVKPQGPPATLKAVALDPQLWRVNAGMFILHVAQMSIFVVVPPLIVSQAGMPVAEHWKIYLPSVLLAFALLMPPVLKAERVGKIRTLMVASILAMMAVAAGFGWLTLNLPVLVALMFLFFLAFNILEATLPSLVSRLAPESARGKAVGLFNTLQAIGLAVGGLTGGFLGQRGGPTLVFGVVIVLMAVWLGLVATMKPIPAIQKR